MAETTVHEQYIPQITRDNYDQVARESAERTGRTPRGEMAAMAKTFAENHKGDITAGWDHLAAWAKDRDPGLVAGVDGLAFALSRAVESARRDPASALASHPDAIAEATAALAGTDGSPATSAAITQA